MIIFTLLSSAPHSLRLQERDRLPAWERELQQCDPPTGAEPVNVCGSLRPPSPSQKHSESYILTSVLHTHVRV